MNKLKSIRLCSKARTILFSVISILLIAIVIRFLVQYHKEYEIVTYGDSITEQFNWQTYLEDYYNESILNLGIGSSAFTNDGYSPAALDIKNIVVVRSLNNESEYIWKRIYYPIKKIIRYFDVKTICQHEISTTRLSSEERLNTIPKTAKLIFIMGGTNDVGPNYSAKEFEMSYIKTISYIQNNIPNSQIILMNPIYSRYKSGSYSDQRNSIKSIIESLSEKYNIKYIDMSLCGIDSTNVSIYTRDGIHPNDEGAKLMGKYILSQLDSE